ncbi:metallophosphoesterase [Candidatus Magnetominusculus dajiuhuensis]|uniref:metallophosphoesterase n=1 Tax=Candidatus Magnetominusculus dajiuhuensis TaxID=3137712 RepID=UPI003B42DF63
MKKQLYLLKSILCWVFILPFLSQCGGSAVQPPPATYSKPLYKWVELGPNGSAIARAVTKGTICPDAAIDSAPVSMRKRPANITIEEKGKWEVTVCEVEIPPEAKSVSVEGTALPLLKKSPSRILVIGDTGCKITDDDAQSCNNSAAWPFPDIAEAATRYKPDLIIHVGDYTYRDSLCPYDNDGCRRSPHGDIWDTWEADLFLPARNLLPAAPWIFLRGDRENCVLNPKGWFRLLDPFPYSERCENFSQPYNVVLDTLTLSVMDSTSADDASYAAAKAGKYSSYIKTYENTASRHRWFLTHRPIWALAQNPNEANHQDSLSTLNHTLQTAFRSAQWDALLSKYDMIISGHLSVFDMFSFNEQGTPPQFIVGNSGTLPDPAISAKVRGYRIGLKTLKDIKSVSTFGFATIEPVGDSWGVTLRDKNGRPITSCDVGPASCQ